MGKIHQRFIAKQMKQMDQQDLRIRGMRHDGVTLNEVLITAKEQDKHEGKYKGHYDGLCNRSACLSSHDVHWYNTGSYAFYCEACANLLNNTNARFKDINNGEPYVHFKTAEEAEKLHVMPAKINYAQAMR